VIAQRQTFKDAAAEPPGHVVEDRRSARSRTPGAPCQLVGLVTGLPAERFSLRDRGLMEVGRAADVTVFDPAKLADRSTWENGRVSPSGIVNVLVNGEAVVTAGVPTRSLPGRIVGRS